MTARIYRPTKTAMQSGRVRTRRWILEFEPTERRGVDPLMGWTTSGDTHAQIRLSFDGKEEAIAYARKNGISFRIDEPMERRSKQLVYADNFRFGRVGGLWTH